MFLFVPRLLGGNLIAFVTVESARLVSQTEEGVWRGDINSPTFSILGGNRNNWMGLRGRAPPRRRPLAASSVILHTLDDSCAKLFIVSLLTSGHY